MLNTVMLIGHLGAAPELRTTADGTAVANFRIATTDKWRDRSGTLQERTEWHTVTCWRTMAEHVKKHLNTGSRVFVEGSLHHTKWTDGEGIERYGVEVNARTVRFLDRVNANGSTAPEEITDETPRT